VGLRPTRVYRIGGPWLIGVGRQPVLAVPRPTPRLAPRFGSCGLRRAQFGCRCIGAGGEVAWAVNAGRRPPLRSTIGTR